MNTSGQFPPIEPYDSGMLDVGAGQRVYWECCGNPKGKPALYLHGGPGSGCGTGARRLFDPEVYRIVLFDQRGAGRSTPSASESDIDLSNNTTAHLICDIEQLREHLGVESWTVLGSSWGSTLALAYAQAHPRRTDALVLALVTTTSRREVQWITEGVGCIFPEDWERFSAAVPHALRDRPLVEAYRIMLLDPDPALSDRAARAWCAWEDTHVSLAPGYKPNPRFQDARFRLGFARLVTHYWSNAAFLEDDQLIRNASILDGIRGVLIHGRYDISTPSEIAWRLAKNWSTSELHLLNDAGHGGESVVSTIIGTLESLARTS